MKKNQYLKIIIGFLLFNLSLAYAKDDTRSELSRFANAYSIIQSTYIDTVSNEQMITHAISGMLNDLDPHSEYISSEDYADLLNDNQTEHNGIGVELIYKKDSPILIYEVIDHSPAQKAKLSSGDLIFKVNSIDVTQATQTEAFKLFDQEPDQVTLTVFRPSSNEFKELTIKKQTIHIENVTASLLKNQLIYVRIREFSFSTVDQFVEAIHQLDQKLKQKKPQGFILDLRNNPGGELEKGVGIACAFLPKNVVITSLKGRQSNHIYFNTPSDYDLLGIDSLSGLPAWIKKIPLVVLSNAASASASELVMGALQDHHRATILGTRSFGKGSVQEIIPLRDNSAIRLTTALYYTPNYRIIQAKGITPDITVSDTEEGNILSNEHEWHLPNYIKTGIRTPDRDTTFIQSQTHTTEFSIGGEKDFQLIQAQRFLLKKPYKQGRPNVYLNPHQRDY